MGEATERRVCAGGCGRKLRPVNKSGYCERCWRTSSKGREYHSRYHGDHYERRRKVKCSDCGVWLNATSSKGTRCNLCWRKTPEGREFYAKNHNRWDRERMATPEAKMLLMVEFANRRAGKAGLPCGVTLQDLMPLPTICPVLGISLDYARAAKTPNTASLDRIVPSLGYVAGNVRIISWRANHIKTDATPDELYAVAMDAMRVAKRIV